MNLLFYLFVCYVSRTLSLLTLNSKYVFVLWIPFSKPLQGNPQIRIVKFCSFKKKWLYFCMLMRLMTVWMLPRCSFMNLILLFCITNYKMQEGYKESDQKVGWWNWFCIKDSTQLRSQSQPQSPPKLPPSTVKLVSFLACVEEQWAIICIKQAQKKLCTISVSAVCIRHKKQTQMSVKVTSFGFATEKSREQYQRKKETNF